MIVKWDVYDDKRTLSCFYYPQFNVKDKNDIKRLYLILTCLEWLSVRLRAIKVQHCGVFIIGQMRIQTFS